VANRYLDDVRRITAGLVAGTPPGGKDTWGDASPPATLADKLNAPALRDRELKPITWTSELSRTIPFDLGPLPEGYPVTGDAVAVGRFGDAAPLRPTDETRDRPLLPIPGDSLGLAAKLELAAADLEVTKLGGRAACTVYFRGQRPTQQVTIDLRGKAELVIADPPPADRVREPFVAVRADRDLKLGPVVMLLDYSESMKWGLNGQWLPGDTEENNSKWRTGPSRFNIAMAAVEKLLLDLPEGTPLRIRVFSGKLRNGQAADGLVFGAGATGKVTWATKEDRGFEELRDKLRGIDPAGVTPLVDSILSAARTDFADPLEGGSPTLLVLTDGAEDPGNTITRGWTPQQWNDFIDGRSERLTSGLKDSGVSVQVVQFGLRSDESRLSTRLFKRLEELETVRLWPVQKGGELGDALLDAIRPKLRLTDRRGIRPQGFPRTGWPSRPGTRRQPPYISNQLYWSPRVPLATDRPYHVVPAPGGESRKVELNLRDGERMILGFGKAGTQVRVRRELYADYIQNPDAKVWRADEGWVMSAPRSVIDDEDEPPALLSRVFLEQVPPHRRPKGDRAAEVESLSFAPPELTWWQVTPARGKGEDPIPTETTWITRYYGWPAPAWDVKVEKWPHSPLKPAEFKVWAADDTSSEKPVTCQLGPPQPLTTSKGDELDMRAAIEKWPAVGFADPIDCLVIRFTFEKGKPIQVRPVDLPVTYSEHRYYGGGIGADGMIAYTAVFQLPLESFKTSGVRLKLMPVQPCLTDGNLLTLSTPTPPGGKSVDADSRPQPTDPSK
jgi:hypothetical protein